MPVLQTTEITRKKIMSYSEFTIDELKSEFALTLEVSEELFANVTPVKPSETLKEILAENIPLALQIDTEKARSEMIIAPILIELRKYFKRQISLFSGTDFTVDRSKKLNGRCDFIISLSAEQLSVTAPVVTMVEAKNDKIKSGIAQCVAEMVAAQIFNAQKNNKISSVYGVVTTASVWKFLKLVGNTVYLESGERYLGDLEEIMGIFAWIINSARS
ncbi:MAG: hypothetical protein SXA11_02615 [Cyanobacteriota bacterium]|nr:hypothetical protein [Cyanobacteriota bacterium]